jgi:hypothetical protein
MRKLVTTAALALALCAGAAHANTVIDPTGDFLPTYTGPQAADLDVTSFTVNYNPSTQNFMLSATLAGAINPATAGSYIIGVDTGTGSIAPFASVGAPNVVFNQAITVLKTGAASVGANSLSALISGNAFSLIVPLADLPSTGAAPLGYGFNLWPRSGAGNSLISDFAPNNSNLLASSVPEPSVWAMMLGGLGLIGVAMRARRSRTVATAA